MKSLRAGADRASQLTLSCPDSGQQLHVVGRARLRRRFKIPAPGVVLCASAGAPRHSLHAALPRPSAFSSRPLTIPVTRFPRPYNQAVCCKGTKNSTEFFTGALAWVKIVPVSPCIKEPCRPLIQPRSSWKYSHWLFSSDARCFFFLFFFFLKDSTK